VKPKIAFHFFRIEAFLKDKCWGSNRNVACSDYSEPMTNAKWSDEGTCVNPTQVGCYHKYSCYYDN